MKQIERERFQVGHIKGQTETHTHVIDTDNGERIVSFRERNQLFYDPEKAEKAAKLLNSGMKPEDINICEL